jgi:formamidopyrimidine-DNA glycosylase
LPELPDVETVARTLRREAVGRRIRRVRVLSPSTVRSPAPVRFASRLRGKRIAQVGRRGKYLLIDLEGDQTLIVHLRMTGGFASASRTDPIHPHTRVVFSFNGEELRFVDQRRFGHMDLVSARDVPTFPGLRRLGVEPLEDAFTLRKFRALLHGRRGTVKGFLLRQDVIAGIGNIYADEILFQSRLLPWRPVESLRPAEAARLYRTIRTVLRRATARLSRYGTAGEQLSVRRDSGACSRCGRAFRTATVAGRTSYYCPACQR